MLRQIDLIEESQKNRGNLRKGLGRRGKREIEIFYGEVTCTLSILEFVLDFVIRMKRKRGK